MTELTRAATVAEELGHHMLGLLASSSQSPIERIVRESLMEDGGRLADLFQRDMSDIAPGDRDRVANLVAAYVRHTLRNAISDVSSPFRSR
jgi:hypothetical protein